MLCPVMCLALAHTSPCRCAAVPQGELASLVALVRDAGAVLLQREVPEAVNEAVAEAAAAAGVPVLQVRLDQNTGLD